jgi:hypothetical protein
MAEFWSAFPTDYSLILRDLLDGAAKALRELPSVSPAKLPRTADFARSGVAGSRCLR